MTTMTELQMTVLAERATKQLKKEHKAKAAEVIESEEYKQFDEKYSDEFVDKLRPLVAEEAKITEEMTNLSNRREAIRASVREALEAQKILPTNPWGSNHPKTELERYIKLKKYKAFPVTKPFNKKKMYHKVEGEVLVSDVQNPAELVQALVDKFKK